MRSSSQRAGGLANAGWFLAGVVAQALFGLLSLLAVQWGFRWWPAGSYTWIPVSRDIASLALTAAMALVLARQGLSLPALSGALLLGRVAGAVAGMAVPGVGLDAGLLAGATFGVLSVGGSGLRFGTVQFPALAAHLGALASGYAWARRITTDRLTRRRGSSPR